MRAFCSRMERPPIHKEDLSKIVSSVMPERAIMTQSYVSAFSPQRREEKPEKAWRLFFGLSRTPHGLLDMATPATAALLVLGAFPPVEIVLVGIVTAFAGYTAIYALNDLVDYRVDRERLAGNDCLSNPEDLDGILVRHPIARDLLSLKSGVLWFTFWAGLALAGGWWLNPVCALLFLAVAALETLYCKLLRVTPLKILPAALVKASGGLVGAYAVQPDPPADFLAILVLWLAAWEVGGQNVANDILDLEEDRKVGARTVATALGIQGPVLIATAASSVAALAGVAVFWFSGPGVGWIYPLGVALLSWKLLIEPARGLYRHPGPESAATLFNRSSYLPLGCLVIAACAVLWPF